MKIYITETHLKKILNESLTPDEQLDEFNNTEDKVKSFFMGKKKVKMWHDRLKEKYPSLLIRFQIDGDVLRAEASIKKIQEQVEESEVDLDDYIGKRVMVYYNLHKHTFSVTYKSKVIMHADYVKLGDVEFRVRPGGKERVRKEKSKNVHAFVIGDLLDYCEFPCTEIPEETSDRIVTYDPYRFDTFVYKSSEEPIYNASEVDMINKRNKLFVIQEVVND